MSLGAFHLVLTGPKALEAPSFGRAPWDPLQHMHRSVALSFDPDFSRVKCADRHLGGCRSGRFDCEAVGISLGSTSSPALAGWTCILSLQCALRMGSSQGGLFHGAYRVPL